MNAQQKWKKGYIAWLESDHLSIEGANQMERFKREALIERRLEAAQRRIEELQILIEQLRRPIHRIGKIGKQNEPPLISH